MVEYARISRMVEFQRKGYWPLDIFPKNGKADLKNKVKDLARILTNKGPVKSSYADSSLSIPTEVFRMGTRGWEYPWVIEILKENLEKNDKVLDCGCGVNGFPLVLNQLGFDAYGLDFFVGRKFKVPGYGLNDSYINKHKSAVTFLNGGMENIPLESNTADAAVCISVMEHVVIEHKEKPGYHLKCLEEMYRVLKPGGLLICTYDTILNSKVVYSGKYGWGPEGWYYKNDIEHLLKNGMKPLKDSGIPARIDILSDEDAYFIPPDFYFAFGYGSGFEDYGNYHRLTSVGFALKK